MAKKHDDDLFKDSVMSFGEHLNELRGTLWRAIVGIFIGVGIGFFFADAVVRLIQLPLEKALQDYYLHDTRSKLLAINPNASESDLQAVLQRKMVFETLWVEPSELAAAIRRDYPTLADRLKVPAEMLSAADIADVASFAAKLRQSEGPGGRVWSLLNDEERHAVESLAGDRAPPPADVARLVAALNRVLDDRNLYDAAKFGDISLDAEDMKKLTNSAELSSDELRNLNWQLMTAAFPGQIASPHPVFVPVKLWRPVENDPRTRTRSLSSQEAFMIWLKAALIVGLVIASPWVFYQLWAFVAAGLYPHERKYVYIYMPFSLVLFLVGVAMSLFVFKPMLAFFLSFNRSLGIEPEPRISEWLSFVMILPLGFGLAFQLPLVMLFLERIRVCTVQSYLRQWRIAVLVIWVIAALVTPADPYSIFLLAVPMMGLFFLGIGLCKWWPRGNQK